MDEEAEMTLDPNLSCKVCGEKQFNLREGFFYCQECGTKQDQVRAIEIDRDDEFNDSKKHIKRQKIQSVKAEKPELTSWECYNYILRGLVEELLSLGAKEEIKLMALQLWAAYLRRTEVAFFNKKHAELPRLGLHFLKKDAQTLYNHCQVQRKKRKLRRNTDDASMVSAESSMREWRKTKRKLDASVYSLHSSMKSSNGCSVSQSSGNSSTSGVTSRAIQLKFSSHARKYLKKRMPAKHLLKHEKDADGLLTCHKLTGSRSSLKYSDHYVHALSIKTVYIILALALNLTEDDIQLSDLARFIDEGHIGTKNVFQYFPENIASDGKKLLKDIKFNLYSHKYTYKHLRLQIEYMVTFLQINEFKKPDISKLALRYITDLNLPQDIAIYVERLINFFPPQMKCRTQHQYPYYEARAMAFVVFVLKLLFGIDGHKEKLFSKTANKINKKLKNFAKPNREQPAPLFVWTEWMEFIEMRKVIVSQYNLSFCRQFKQCQSTAQLLEDIGEEQKCQDEQDALTAAGVAKQNAKLSNMHHILENFLRNYSTEKVQTISFQPSFTPAHSYFKRILLHASTEAESMLKIPEFMRVDHSQRSLQPYLEPQSLRQYFSERNMLLEVRSLPCTSNRCFVGVFRSTKPPVFRANSLKVLKANFNISEEKWLSGIGDEPHNEELQFKNELESYDKNHMRILNKRMAAHNPNSDFEGIIESNVESSQLSTQCFLMPPSVFRAKIESKNMKNGDNFDVKSMRSIDVFSEHDMEPITGLNLDRPRRRLDTVNIFNGLSDGKETENGNTQPDVTEATDEFIKIVKSESDDGDDDDSEGNFVPFLTSKLDCWMLSGYMKVLDLTQKNMMATKLPRSFFWLLETCAQTIGVEWGILYEQVLAIELMYAYGLENLDDFEDCLRYKYNYPIKDFNMLLNKYRYTW